MKLTDMSDEQVGQIIRKSSKLKDKIREYCWDTAGAVIDEYLSYFPADIINCEINYGGSWINVRDEKNFINTCLARSKDTALFSSRDIELLEKLKDIYSQYEDAYFEGSPNLESLEIELNDGIDIIATHLTSYLESFYAQCYDDDFLIDEFLNVYYDVPPFDEIEVDEDGNLYQLVRKNWN